MWTKTCSLLLACSALMFAQHGYTPSEAEAGGQIFQSGCSRCHGQDGDGVPPMVLLREKFRRAYTDDELVKIIQTGIAGTAMPPGNYTTAQARTVVAYIHSSAAAAIANSAPPGDPARGKMIVENKGGCLNCHRINGVGARMGPDLTNIGSLRNSRYLEQSILDPNAEIAVENRFVRVTTRNGTTITGRLLNQDIFTVQLMDDKERLRSFLRSDLKEFAFLDKSIMPSYQGKLTPQELGDVVSYLHSLKGIENQ
jgi:putative heme-binding domain-containing protein